LESVFLDACRRKNVEYTPVWFMRQAGRYLPSYRKLRGTRGVLEIAKDPELASNVAVEPVKKLGVDAAILFADIMLPLEGVGIKFNIQENLGPVVQNKIESRKDVDLIGEFDAETHVPYVLQTIEKTNEKLNGIPLIGFSGAPFTLAGYLIEGSPSREFVLTKRMMYQKPDAWRELMRKLTNLVKKYLAAQVASGASAIQLFDSWVGCLSPVDYETFVMKYTKEIFDSLHGRVPTIHFCANSSGLIEDFARTGCDVISVDWRLPINQAWKRSGNRHAVQGNLDPALAVSGGKLMDKGTRDILKRASGHAGHIFSLGHGVMRETPPSNLQRVVTLVHSETRAK
jgi:uroporphyrinogen decarboxylase